MKDSKISIIMSTYNRKEFLPRSIEGVLSQTYDNFEFILVNNGSTDDSNVICEKYANQDDRIKIINIDQNHGPMIGRMSGLNIASNEYLTFVDDDDYCAPQMIEFLWNLLNEHKADISICGSWYDFDGKKEPKYIFDDYLILNKVQAIDELLKREKYNVAPPTKLFRKTLFEGISFNQNVMVDDIHIIYQVFSNADKVVAHGQPLYSFAKHNSNLTSFTQTNILSPQLLDEYLSAFHVRTEFLSRKVPEISTRARYAELSFIISMCDKIKKYNNIECLRLYDSMINTLQKNLNDMINCDFITERELQLLKEHKIIK